jgi:hypothetical protein
VEEGVSKKKDDGCYNLQDLNSCRRVAARPDRGRFFFFLLADRRSQRWGGPCCPPRPSLLAAQESSPGCEAGCRGQDEPGTPRPPGPTGGPPGRGGIVYRGGFSSFGRSLVGAGGVRTPAGCPSLAAPQDSRGNPAGQPTETTTSLGSRLRRSRQERRPGGGWSGVGVPLTRRLSAIQTSHTNSVRLGYLTLLLLRHSLG